jgi:protoporphyrinogen oxidase
MRRIAVIGSGISGLAIANLLNKEFSVKIFESKNKSGGLIACDRINGILFHKVGGHVFNSKNKNVLDWFWRFFDKEQEFVKATRNAVIHLGNSFVNYPIENFIYQLPTETIKDIIADLLKLNAAKNNLKNFQEFLLANFGKTLYEIYFKPYNKKIWNCNLSEISLDWLSGKLPNPSIQEIIYNNFVKANETSMVHSSFYYPKENGSQFIADRLAKNLDIEYNSKINSIKRNGEKWSVGDYECDKVIFCGNILDLPKILKRDFRGIKELKYHGTTSALCEIKNNPYSWVYMPNENHKSHRVICTGNFSKTNNGQNKLTATIEWTDKISEDDILKNLKNIPFSPKYVTHNYEKYTYPIQDKNTRDMISTIKSKLQKENFFLLGRFAEWEYYNMDTAIEAAMKLHNFLFYA